MIRRNLLCPPVGMRGDTHWDVVLFCAKIGHPGPVQSGDCLNITKGENNGWVLDLTMTMKMGNQKDTKILPLLRHRQEVLIVINNYCLFLARQPPSGPGPPHSRGF